MAALEPDPNYPTGALEALHEPSESTHRIARKRLDALAAMSPEDRAALARWLNPVEPFTDRARTAALAVGAAECRWCGHVHDPEDGHCDAHANVGLGRCECPGEGLAVAYDKINAALLAAEQDCAELRGQIAEAEAATVKRITEWLRSEAPSQHNAAARAIERKFGGGPDAVK